MASMTLGVEVRIQPDAAPFYRKGGTSLIGSVVSVSTPGTVARVHLDNTADTYVRTDDLAIVSDREDR